jgi:hypothetical protein
VSVRQDRPVYQDRVKEVSVGRGVLVEPERAAPRMQTYQYERAPVVQTVQYDRAPVVQTVQYERGSMQYRDDTSRQYERSAPTAQYERSIPSVVSYGERERERSSFGGRQSISSYTTSSGYQPASGGYATTTYGQQGGAYVVASNSSSKGKGNNVEIMS